jgi:hypothetical protein
VNQPGDLDRWQVYFPLSVSRELSAEPSFHALLAFARAMNVVRFALEDLARDFDATVPANRRRLAGTLFLVGGLLNEIRISSNRLGQWYRDVPEYAELSAVWKSDPLSAPPLKGLIKIRNAALAHFDVEPFATLLSHEIVHQEFRWAEGRGPAMGELYYELADDLVLNILVGPVNSPDEFRVRAEDMLQAFKAILLNLHKAGAHLISAVTRRLGAEVRRVEF